MPRQTLSHFLEKPAIAVGILEGGVGAIAATLRIEADDNAFPVEVMEDATNVVKRFAHLHTAPLQFGTCRRDVGDDEMQALCRTRHGRRDAAAEDNRACRTRRRELYDAVMVARDVVQVEAPSQFSIKALGTMRIRNGDDNHLELHIGLL